MYGVIVILPTDPPLNQMDVLREKYSPIGQSICGTHISLTVPLAKEVSEADWNELRDIAAGLKPITIKYGPLSCFLPAPVLFLAV